MESISQKEIQLIKDFIFEYLNKTYNPEFSKKVLYLTIMGSHAYGVATPDSDIDIYGCFMPGLKELYPSQFGHLNGFDPEVKHQHNIEFSLELSKKVDVNLINLCSYYKLLKENNPNILESIFTEQGDKIYVHESFSKTLVWNKSFLSKLLIPKFWGYCQSQILKSQKNESPGRDLKYYYHLIRLVNELEYILTHQDLKLQTNCSILRDIRQGLLSPQEIFNYFENKKIIIEELIEKTSLNKSPDNIQIKFLLNNAIKNYFENIY